MSVEDSGEGRSELLTHPSYLQPQPYLSASGEQLVTNHFNPHNQLAPVMGNHRQWTAHPPTICPPQHPLTNNYFSAPLVTSPLLNQPATYSNPFQIKQEPGVDGQFVPPFTNNGALPATSLYMKQGTSPYVSHEPGTNPYIKQEPGTGPYIKQEPGTGPYIKQEPGTEPPFITSESIPFIKQEPGAGDSFQPRTPIKQESYVEFPPMKQELSHMFPSHSALQRHHSLPAPLLTANEVSFPSQPLNLNFMADIEDIVQPSIYDVSIDSIKNELSCFDGPSDLKYKVKEEVVEESWEPALWKQQYENIRKMRAKRDAPVDKYGCFMNAEKDVEPEVRRYQVLVSLMLSSQTKDEVVGKAMTKLKQNKLTVDNVLDTPQEEIARMIFPVGFWNKKAEYIKKTTKILKEKFASDIPNTVEGLISLPGIGPKMAHLIMDFAWGQISGISVDTHVHRITHRLGWMRREARNPEEARKSLEKWFPREEWSDLNLLCVGFGQQICSPVGPKCSDCLNKDMCPSSSCLVSSGLPLGIGFEVSAKSKAKKAKSSPVTTKGKAKKIKIET